MDLGDLGCAVLCCAHLSKETGSLARFSWLAGLGGEEQSKDTPSGCLG